MRDLVVYDSGCSTTTFNHRKWFKLLEPLPKPSTSLSSSGNLTQATHAGTVSYDTVLQDGTVVTMEIGRAIYQPSLPCNLISSLDLVDNGVLWDQSDHTLFRRDDGQVLAEMETAYNVPTINAFPSPSSDNWAYAEPAFVAVPYRQMHRRLMHASKAVVEEACRQAGITLTHKDDTLCDGCMMGKAHDDLGKMAPVETNAPFDFIRVDTVTHQNPGHLGYKYSIHIVDAWPNYHWVKFARTKDGCFVALCDFVEMIETQTSRKVKIIGIDGGTEFGQATRPFSDSKFNAWARSKGIITMVTTPHTPWMNGKIERAAKDVIEKTRSTMIAYNIPERLFPFVMETVVQVMNLLPTKANADHQSPQQMLATALNMPDGAHQPHVGHLRAYFCEAYYYVKPAYRHNSDKFTPRAKKARLIGYADLHGKIYWLWNPQTDEIMRASAVRFNEGPDFQPDDDVAADYEVVFDDDTTDEEEEDANAHPTGIVGVDTGQSRPSPQLKAPEAPSPRPQTPSPKEPLHPQKPSAQGAEDEGSVVDWYSADDSDPGNIQLPTPEPTPDPADRQEIQQDAPIPPDHPLAPYTGHAIAISPPPGSPQSVGGLNPTQTVGGPSAGTQRLTRPRRNKAKYGEEPGYYAKLAEGKLPSQNHFTAHLVEPAPPAPLVEFTLSHVKAEHDIETSRRSDLPQNYRQASQLANFEEYWLPAMRQQDKSLHEKEVYDLVRKRPGMTVLPSKWVFDEKTDPTTGVTTARARWVVCGNFDQGSWDSQDLYAAVVNSVSVKTFFALVAVEDLECHQFDFKTAFLNASIPDDVEYYVQPPPGLDKPSGFVCKLKKALYGLRQSPLYWFLTIKPVMEHLGFESLRSDLCLFRHKKTGALVVLYVDDLLVAARTMGIINAICDQLRGVYDLKEIGEVQRFLGFDVIRDRANRKFYISQASYIKTLLQKVDMWDCNPVTTPWPNKLELPTTWEPIAWATKGYIKKTGSLNWVSTGTRPDIAYTVSRLCEANSGPSQAHLDLMTHLWRYLRGSYDYALVFGGKGLGPKDLVPHVFADASWADCMPSRHSTGGHIVFVAGGPVHWKTKKQTFVALSTTEAEFANLTPAGQSAIWVANILNECGYPQEAPKVIYTDSMNAYLTVLNPHNAARTRCLDIRYKWVIEQAQRGRFKVEHISGADMPADGLTKPLARKRHGIFVRLLGIATKKVPWIEG